MNKGEMWREYERRKKIIQDSNPTPEEYERQIKKLCRELGL